MHMNVWQLITRYSRWFWRGVSVNLVLGILVLAVVTVVVIGVVWWQWSWLNGGGSITESNSTTLRNVGFVVGGVLAFAFAFWRSWVAAQQASAAQKQASTAQQGLLNDWHQRGADMLSNDVVAVRMGGIYALQKLAETHPEEFHLHVMWLLCAFVRNPPKDDALDEPKIVDWEPFDLSIRPDVQAAVSAIGERTLQQIELEQGFTVDLHGANLVRGHFRQHYLRGADLTWADLSGADLEAACLAEARLTYAKLYDVNLVGADLTETTCTRSDFGNSNAQAANLSMSNLEGSIWVNANLKHAVLRFAMLKGADLSAATLQRAELTGTAFGKGPRRVEHYSTEGHLGLSGEPAFTRLTQSQLDQAIADDECPPAIEQGTIDTVTNVQLVWRRSALP